MSHLPVVAPLEVHEYADPLCSFHYENQKLRIQSRNEMNSACTVISLRINDVNFEKSKTGTSVFFFSECFVFHWYIYYRDERKSMLNPRVTKYVPLGKNKDALNFHPLISMSMSDFQLKADLSSYKPPPFLF